MSPLFRGDSGTLAQGSDLSPVRDLRHMAISIQKPGGGYTAQVTLLSGQLR
jgi:hypothetical protein